MLHILVGSDFLKIKKRTAELTRGAAVVRFGEGGEPLQSSVGALGSAGLFSAKVALVVDRPFEDAEQKEFFIEHAKDFADSDTIVVAITAGIDATTKKKLPKSSAIEEFDIETETEEVLPSAFALADAFVKGDRKTSWVLYRRFIEGGVSPEEIHGTLSWQARSLVLASKTKSAEEAGLKPFAYTKAKSALSKMKTPPEVVSRELVALYHRSRMGEGSLEDLLEVFLLKKG